MFRRLGAVSALFCALAVPAPAHAEEEEEEAELRERLTEREDKRRPLEPWSTELFGHPLTLGGEWEIELGYLRRRSLDDSVRETDRFRMEQGLEVEAFYTIGKPLSVFLQFQGVMEEELTGPTNVSNLFVERGEMWLYSENIFGTNLNVDIGRLDFEDERRWWWEDELDAVRLEYERETFDVALALAQELTSDRLDQGRVDADEEGVVRLIGEAGWEWSENHSFEAFLLHQDDHSSHLAPKEGRDPDREDDTDARLTWLGARALGIFELRTRGYLGYWLDGALVTGEERTIVESGPEEDPVETLIHRDVSGWAFDGGITWILPWAYEPRLFAGYAFGSGDSEPDEKDDLEPNTGTDRAFRQTGLNANEAGFGGVERFVSYGALLAPELSNLGILTVGAGLSLFRSSSLDLVYHHYRQVEPTTSQDMRIAADLTGRDRQLGDELDLVLALEEWERLEFTIIASVFRAGRAFGQDEGDWSSFGFLAVRYAF